ncbi:MAG: fructose-bisphosphate aldolase class I [Candidatus Nomurabacteria bacterium]|nr:fructose-bisphosphate aldolase class I [Candidatus Nomurabacteria bacterium]USN88047.1 MAG: fructose-bisphosphate aldolase class I [Candidatus Nomurabacteria bacterium]
MKKNTKLYETVAALMASGKGILAADESNKTAGKRLEMVHLANEPENRQDFRELLFTAPEIEKYLSGVIMYDSSIKNSTDDGTPFPDVLTAKGIVPGIKVDLGTVDLHGFKGEVVTQGLDNLADRLKEYYDLGARFAKWRAVITIDDEETPTDAAITMNAVFLARYAQLAQAAGIVPMVEPEVIYAGDHSLSRAELVTTRTLQILFQTLQTYRVDLGGLILKSSMVLAGDMNAEQSTPEQVANATLRTFHLSVPHEVGGIVFLSGGQTPKRATENLNAIAGLGEQPWPITFSYSRAIEEPFLQTWGGKPENAEEAQKMLLHVCRMNSLASQGKYDSAKDKKLK